MRDVARRAFVPLTVSFEGGFITWMFPDVKGLVSTGFGLLLDPVALALGLPWKRADGTLASREEIVADFYRVKNHPDAARLGHLSVKNVAGLRLDNDGLYQAFQGKLNANDRYMATVFPDWEEWCADSQLATLSMCWAVGPAFQRQWPKFTEALRARDYMTASVECFMPEEAHIGGLRPRNKANRILYRNAAFVHKGQLDHDTLFYPRDLMVDGDTPTLPILVPEVRPDPLGHVEIVHPRVPLGRPALDGDDEPPDDAA